MELEICCGSYEDALIAYQGGACRVELNSALYLGGLTPSLGSLILTKKLPGLKVIAMVRCRGAGFCYSREEFAQMMLDAKLLLEHGADGLAFGFLQADARLDLPKIRQMITLIHSYHKEAVFHRAIDVSDNLLKNAKILTNLGVDRILTSGGYPKAIDGLETLAELLSYDVEILAGSGISAENVQAFKEIGITQVHASCRAFVNDPTTSGQHVNFAYLDNNYERVSLSKVTALRRAIDE